MRFEFWPYDDKKFDISVPPTVVESDTLDRAIGVAVSQLGAGRPTVSLLVRQENWKEGRFVVVLYRLDYVRHSVRDVVL